MNSNSNIFTKALILGIAVLTIGGGTKAATCDGGYGNGRGQRGVVYQYGKETGARTLGGQVTLATGVGGVLYGLGGGGNTTDLGGIGGHPNVGPGKICYGGLIRGGHGS